MYRLTLFFLLFSGVVAAHDDESALKAIERLESRIERLEMRLGVQPDPEAPASTTEAVVPDRRERQAPEVAEAISPGLVSTRYWLLKTSPFEGETQTPLREGEMTLSEIIDLEPKHYGQESGGIFNPYLDPSRFPVAAVSIDGHLYIEKQGRYRLVIKPNPPREVGGAGNVQVSVDVTVAGERLFSLPPSASLVTREKEVVLPAGRLPLRVEVVSRSPGFGPSPTRAKVFIGLQAYGAIAPVPISSYVAPVGVK